ncbi:MAG: cell filamentation protein Fic [Lachnospiraceae bacterium]|nr:cell filamentation protein Fic [Lachnospiraceae bacterium]
MTTERNILLAKKYMVESIYRSANIEGIGVTFPETQAICDGMSISGHTIDEINAVNDLKNAWRYIFDNIEKLNPDLELLKTLNQICGKNTVLNSGCLRNGYDEPIRITLKDGRSYYPQLPDEDRIKSDLEMILNQNNVAGELFCYICKGQFFMDGNKRTATLYANFYMIKNGLGILSIPPEKKLDFYNLLTDFYEDDNKKKEIIDFLYESCITL